MMAQDESVEAVGSVFGQVQGEFDGSSSSSSSVKNELFPSLFSLAPKDAHHLRLCVSDFRSSTWQADFSVSQLEEFRSLVGIDGWDDFLAYVKAAFSSIYVHLILGGELADSVGGTISARLVAQKARRLPRVELPLEKLEGSAAEDAKSAIALGNYKAFRALSSVLDSEKAQTAGLKALFTAEKAKAENLQEQINASSKSFASRSKPNRTLSSLPTYDPQLSTLPQSQLDRQVVLPSLPATTVVSGPLNDGKEVAVPKGPGSKTRVHVAPVPRRAKRRGTVISDRTDP